MKIAAALLFRPSSLAILVALASAAIWSLPVSPNEVRTGYDVPSQFTPTSVLVIVDWYALIFVAMRGGEFMGKSARWLDLPRAGLVALDSKLLLGTYTALTMLGLASTYRTILATLSVEEIILLLSTGVGNQLKTNLYENYSAGLVSLRYLASCSFAIAAYRYSTTRRFEALLAVNVLLLVMSAVISSRLIFVAGVLMCLFMIYAHKRFLRINLVAAGMFSALTFSVLALFNYSRNSNFYAAGDVDFWDAGVSSIVAYLGSPFQVMLSVADHLEGVVGQDGEAYRTFTDISETLNSNSSLLQLHESFGYWAWPYIGTVCFVAGFVFAKCRKLGRTALLVPCGAILYSAAELWRLDLFGQGVFLVWISLGFTIPYVLSGVGHLVRRNPGRHGRPPTRASPA